VTKENEEQLATCRRASRGVWLNEMVNPQSHFEDLQQNTSGR
jgi:hypothetical protein